MYRSMVERLILSAMSATSCSIPLSAGHKISPLFPRLNTSLRRQE